MDLSKALSTPNQEPTTAAPMEQIDPETGEVVTIPNITSDISLNIEGEFDFDSLESAEVGINYRSVYWSPSKAGQTSRGYFQGFSTISKNEPDGAKEIEVALWLTRDGLLMNGGAGFVSRFKDVPLGAPIIIEFEGKAKTAAGHSVNTFKVSALNIKK